MVEETWCEEEISAATMFETEGDPKQNEYVFDKLRAHVYGIHLRV